jgi:diguanylate cyclase (GGDEF)-like protein/PAS domain S-box-containing protein
MYAEGQTSILIVEDDNAITLELSRQLTEISYRVAGHTRSGASALIMAGEMRPDLVLVDIALEGDPDGIETARRIDQNFGVPVIFLATYADTEIIARAAEITPHGFLAKPIQARELRAAIEVALYKSRVERRLRESERWFSATLNCVADGVIATDRAGRVTFLNPIAERLTEWPASEAIGKDVDQILHRHAVASLQELRSPLRLTLATNEPVGMRYGATILGRSGTQITIDDSAAPIRGEDGMVIGAVAVFRDASERLKHEQQLRESEERFRRVFDVSAIGMVLVSLSGIVLRANEAFCRLLGCEYGTLETLRMDQLVDAADAAREQVLLEQLVDGTTAVVALEKCYIDRGDGSMISTQTVISLLTEPSGPLCYLYQVSDLTERKRAEAQLERLAYYDPLTGLSNRTHLRHEIERLLSTARRKSEALAVLFIDLDRFKQINDTLGHEIGDLLLETVACRLRSVLRESDCVGRQGGDEFVLVLPGINAPRKAASIAEKVRKVISKPMQIAGHSLIITPSIGVSLFPSDGQDGQTLVRNADAALYAAKGEGRNLVRFFRPELTEQMRERLELESALRTAVAQSEFVLEYQPLVRPADGEILAFEALVRWQREDERVEPNRFIPVAEETGLIIQIGEWVLGAACMQAARWPMHIGLNVNCSPRQFQDSGLYEVVVRALNQSGLAAERLCLELTEDVMLSSSASQAENFRRLRAIGVSLSVDDYGTGYSSLAYLKRFEPDTLKIDRMFVSDMIDHPTSAAIVSATIVMAHNLGLKAVAEGVETPQQAAFLCAQGCDVVQGFYFARPLSPEDALIAARSGGTIAQAPPRTMSKFAR